MRARREDTSDAVHDVVAQAIDDQSQAKRRERPTNGAGGVRAPEHRGEYVSKNEIRYNGRIVPRAVKIAMDRGGFATPGAVADGIRDGAITFTGAANSRSTITGIGKARFLELCTFFEIDPQTLPGAVPIETRIAIKINDAVPLDLAFSEVVRSNIYIRQTIKLVARLTRELTPDGLKRFQDWGKESGTGL